MPQFLDATAPDFEIAFTHLLNAKREDSPDVDAIVADIIADVRARGDAAVIDLTAKFDRMNLAPDTLAFSPEEIELNCAVVPNHEREALEGWSDGDQKPPMLDTCHTMDSKGAVVQTYWPHFYQPQEESNQRNRDSHIIATANTETTTGR